MVPEPRVDRVVVDDRVAAVVVTLARRQQRHQVQVGDAELGQVVEPLSRRRPGRRRTGRRRRRSRPSGPAGTSRGRPRGAGRARAARPVGRPRRSTTRSTRRPHERGQRVDVAAGARTAGPAARRGRGGAARDEPPGPRPRPARARRRRGRATPGSSASSTARARSRLSGPGSGSGITEDRRGGRFGRVEPVVAVAGEVITDLVPAGEDGRLPGRPRRQPGERRRRPGPARRAGADARAALRRRARAPAARAPGRQRRRPLVRRRGARAVVAGDRRAAGRRLGGVRLPGRRHGRLAVDRRRARRRRWTASVALHVGSLGAHHPAGRRRAAPARRPRDGHGDGVLRPERAAPADGAARRGARGRARAARASPTSSRPATRTSPGWSRTGRPRRSPPTWLSHGPALVVVTRGGDGCVGVGPAPAARSSRPGVAVDVVDTVGAGDSFMSALLAGLARRDLLGADRRDALRSLTGRRRRCPARRGGRRVGDHLLATRRRSSTPRRTAIRALAGGPRRELNQSTRGSPCATVEQLLSQPHQCR